MQFEQLKRREFITLLGGAAAAWPVAARGQQPALPVIGLLGGSLPAERKPLLVAFKKGLAESTLLARADEVIE